MTLFKPRNAYYLRISTDVILPLFLYLDERHIDWMSDVVLQHVLADLRPLIIPKLQAEKDVHFGPGAAPGNKQGIVEVHRGETYQFAYFFRKTEPHTVLLKSRYFVTAPAPSEVALKSASGGTRNPSPQKKGLDAEIPANTSKRKRSKPKGKKKASRDQMDEDEWSPEESEGDMDADDPIPREPRPVRKQRRFVTDASPEDDDSNVEDTDVGMDSPSLETDEGSNIPNDDRGVIPSDANDEPPDTTHIELVVEDEEEKPKPLLKLKYQSFTISGHCLCVVVEPWPPLRAEPKRLGISPQRGASNPPFHPLSEAVTMGEGTKTPLFLPEYDRAPSEAPFRREWTLPPVPLSNDDVSAENDDYSDDDLMVFSQTLNAGGQMHAIAADDDDDMDGAVLFGDADEVKELF